MDYSYLCLSTISFCISWFQQGDPQNEWMLCQGLVFCHMLVWHLMILSCHCSKSTLLEIVIYTHTQILDRRHACWKRSHVRQNGCRKKQMYVSYYIVEWGAHQMPICIPNDTRINVKELYEWECWVKNIMLNGGACEWSSIMHLCLETNNHFQCQLDAKRM